jgi:hypothetical protein
MGKKTGQKKAGQTLGQTKDQTPLLPLSGTRKVVRTPTNPFEVAGTVEVFVPKEIIARRIQDIFAGPNRSACVRVSELFRTEFLDTTINNCQTG